MATEVHIQLLYRTTRVPLSTVQQAAAAVQVQVAEHFAPAWGIGDNTSLSVVGADDKPDPTAWWMLIIDTPDVAGALGYHDTTSEGLPLGKCFVEPTLDAGLPLSGVISHEVLEALLDPLCNEWAYDDAGSFWALEASDAVQGWDYTMDGVSLSDFVYPSFFHKADKTPPYDHLGNIKHPFQTGTQGYQIKYNRTKGMHQVYGTRKSLLLPASWGKPSPPPGSRRERRLRGRSAWRKSSTRV